MKSFCILLAATLATAVSIPLQPRGNAPNKPGYSATFIETFSGDANTLPSSSNWIFDTGTQYPTGPSQWGNSEAQTYTKSTSNVAITRDHTLQITPLHQNDRWTSARLESARSDFAAAPGRKLLIEARIKLGNAPASQQQGIWPAFWALGSDFRGNYNNWPSVGETDFLESINGENAIHHVVHCGAPGQGGPCNEYNGIGGTVAFSRGDWHTVTFVIDRTASSWQQETMSWFVDGNPSFSISGARVGDQGAWESLAHSKRFLILNVAVGGNWAGAPDGQTVDGKGIGMEVDYVGVWNS